ncbi:MAG: hypothetical protein OEZ06_25330 [Myxococcales bacterium]|nr:hypothetical protein [Myxococcales bacterium]
MGATAYPKGIGLSLWAFVFVGLLLSAGRHPVDGDARQMCLVASQLDRAALGTPSRSRIDMVQGSDGLWYSKYPLGPVLQCRLSQQLSQLGPTDPDAPATRLLMATAPAAVAALVALGFFMLATTLGFGPVMALPMSLALVFTTHLFAYGRILHSEGLQAAAVVFCLHGWIGIRRDPSPRRLLLGGALLGLAPHAKATLLILSPIALAYFLFAHRGRSQLRELLLYGGAGALPPLALWAAYNHLRFGSMVELGYLTERDAALGFSTPLLSGLHGLLLSPGKSLFLYAPVTLLSVLGVRSMWREARLEAAFVLAPCAILLLLAATWWSGHGDWGWGPRLLIAALPALLVPALYALRGSRRRFRLFQALAACGLVINLLGIVVYHADYLGLLTRVTVPSLVPDPQQGRGVRDDLVVAHFVPEFSPVVGHGWMLWRHLEGKPFDSHDDYPWKSLRIPAWRLTKEHDPMTSELNHFSDGSATGWSLAVLLSLAWLALGVRIAQRAKAKNLRRIE